MKLLDTKYLRLAVVLSETESLTLTGQRLHLSQPAVSHQLKALEEFVGAPVFERQGKRMVPNPAGKHLAQKARELLLELEQTASDTRQLVAGSKGVIRIATSCFTCYNWLPKVLKQFQLRYPDVNIDINPHAASNVHQHLLEEEIDIGLVNSVANEGLFYAPLFQDEVMLLVCADSPLAKRQSISIADTLDEHWVFYTGTEKKYISVLFESNGYSTPEKISTFNLTEVIVEWVAAGLGITTLAGWAAQPYLTREDVVAIPLTDSALSCREWYTATRYADPPESWQYFIRLLAENPPLHRKTINR